MMRIVFDPQAERDFDNQLAFLIDQGAAQAARTLERRLTRFVEQTLATYPRSGKYIVSGVRLPHSGPVRLVA